MRKCNTVVLSEYFYPDDAGSTGTILSELSRHLFDGYPNINIRVITSSNLYRGIQRPLPAEEEWDGIQIVRIDSQNSRRASMIVRLTLGLWFSVKALVYLLMGPRADVVLVVTNPPPLVLAAWVYRMIFRVPYVYLIHDLYPDLPIAMTKLNNDGIIAKLCRYVQLSWLRSAYKVIVLSRAMQEYIAQKYMIASSRIDIIPNWGQNKELVINNTEQYGLREKFSSDDFVILYAGNFSEYIDFSTLVSAAGIISKQNPNVKFVFVGNGNRRDYLETESKKANANIFVFPPVPQKQMTTVWGVADVCIVPVGNGLDGLGVPSKFYAVMAAAKAVLALAPSDSEVATVVMEHNCGIVSEPGNVKKLTENILAMSQNTKEVQAMGQRGLDAIAEKYNVVAVSKQYYTVLTDAANQATF